MAHAGERTAAVDRTRTGQHGGSIGLVLLIAVALVGAGVGLMLIGRTKAEPYILALLAVLAMVGVFLLFALAAGMLRATGRDAASPLIKSLVDGATDAILVTDAAGRVIYANVAYLDLVAATDADDVRPVERVFVGDPGVSEAVFRLLKAAREGRRLQEEVRVDGQRARPDGGCACACARSARASASSASRCGRSPTSPASSSGRRTCSRNCSTPSTISIMRRPASSRSMPRAASPISTPRWRSGSTRISPRSAMAG